MGKGLYIGMKVNLEIARDDKIHYFPSKIEDIISDDVITIGMPMQKNMTFFVGLNEIIRLYFNVGDLYYCINCKVVEKIYEPIPVLNVYFISEPYRYQRRKYFRIKIYLEVSVKIDKKEIKGFTRNLSASGALLALNENLHKGTLIKLEIPIPSSLITAKAIVVRNEKNKFREINTYDVAVHFVDINEKTRDELIKFVLDEQRKLRKKGFI